ncbi:unnamed protein product [Arabidopsis halleri]
MTSLQIHSDFNHRKQKRKEKRESERDLFRVCSLQC